MKNIQAFLSNLNPYIICALSSTLTIAQIVLAFTLHHPRSSAIQWAGWVLWWTSAVFGWLPIFTLHRKGGVPKGKSYVHTTQLVESGIYAIVRHPQIGTAWLLMSLGLMLITQHWISVALGLPAMGLVYLDVLKADQRLIKKFGEAYEQYMARVPRVNFVSGMARLILRRLRTGKSHRTSSSSRPTTSTPSTPSRSMPWTISSNPSAVNGLSKPSNAPKNHSRTSQRRLPPF